MMIEHDEVEGRPPEVEEPLATVRGGGDAETGLLQAKLGHFPDRRVVLDQ
jgi:hypothetical protein